MKLFLFNPENDLALANADPNFIPPLSARTMAADLDVLPMWWAGEGDAVWVSAPERAEAFMQDAGTIAPRVDWYDGQVMPAVGEFCPWGWNPMLLHALRKHGFEKELLPSDERMAVLRALSGRQTAVTLLNDFRRDVADGFEGETPVWCGESFYCTGEEEIVGLLRKYPETLLKAPWSGSGKGLRLGRGGWQPPLSGWCRNLLARQGAVVVEPLYEKKVDLAMEFYSDGAGAVRYAGLSLFATTEQGAYRSSRVASEEVKRAHLRRWVTDAVYRKVQSFLTERLTVLVGSVYKGFLGVDMMVCRAPGRGGYCLHPCVEVNLRMTMGMVSVFLERYLPEGVEAEFGIAYSSQPDRLRMEAGRRRAEHPLRVTAGRIADGYCPLTPVDGQTRYHAWLQVVVSPGARTAVI